MWFEPEIPENLTIREKELLRAYVGFAYDKAAYFGQYETAVNIIIKTIYETKSSVTLVCHPLLYLIRHSLELGLKINNETLKSYNVNAANRVVKKTHNLKKLVSDFKDNFNEVNKVKNLSQQIVVLFFKDLEIAESLIEDLGVDDSAFRYPTTAKDESIFKDTSKVIDILDIIHKYRITMKMLSCLVDTIEIDINRRSASIL